MSVNMERLRLGIAALRSGEYLRGIGKLHSISGGVHRWCCLGVLSDVAEKNGCQVRRSFSSRYVTFDLEQFGDQMQEYLSSEVMEWYGFSSEDPYLASENWHSIRASSLNDNTSPDTDPGFGYVADAFERTFTEE